MKKKLPKLSKLFARCLLLCVLLALAATAVSIWMIQTYISEREAYDLLRLNIQDVYQDIISVSNESMLKTAHAVARDLAPKTPESSEELTLIAQKHDVSEINIINEQGIISHSSNPAFIGFDMSRGAQSKEFLVLLDGAQEYVQDYLPISYDTSISRKYAGVVLPHGGFVQVGYDAARFQQEIHSQVVGATRNRHVGETGCIILCNENWEIISDRHGYENHNLSNTGLDRILSNLSQGEVFEATIHGTSAYCMYLTVEGYYAISVLPQQEVTRSRNISAAITLGVECLVFTALYVVMYFFLRQRIVDNVLTINDSLARIAGGALEEQVDVGGSMEFTALSHDINTTVATLKQYITDAENRMDQELEFARIIQNAALPSVFPPFPNRTEFSIYACMQPAKEVGGDFYDFYLLNERSLVFLVADVSEKGIPAALFMMQAKTLLQDLAESGLSVDQILNQANDRLSQNNEVNMFVTVWMGILDLDTGLLRYANAGHTPPMLRRHTGDSFELLEGPSGLVLAGIEGITYQEQTLKMHPGDLLYLYTDGVTEATDASEKLFGTQRLRKTLDQAESCHVQALCEAVLKALDGFVGDAPQFDDITMLSVLYQGGAAVDELTIAAMVNNLNEVTAFVEAQLAQRDCPPNILLQLTLAVEEIFINISSYAYDSEVGLATIRVETHPVPMEVAISFIDKGKPYNPLQEQAPDLSLSADARPLGGLGIFLVKNIIDSIYYEYRDGKNILRIIKRW